MRVDCPRFISNGLRETLMKSLINRLQKDVAKLQDTFQKESADFIDRISRVELKDNLEQKKKSLRKS